jgi:N,N'-diacetyllegionaminate synthase
MKVEIIAEIAQGYEGNEKLSEILVKGAIVANADSVKMQLIYADELCVPNYQYFDLFRSLEMREDIWRQIVLKVQKANKYFYFDVYGDRSLDLACELKVDGVKISTTDFYNFPLIEKAFTKFNNVFISAGGIKVEDLDNLVNNFELPKKLTLMHGFQSEPTQLEDNNLSRIETLRYRYPNVNIGFMDHSAGNDESSILLPMIALGAGVTCIEKHISLDYKLEIEDYISALSIDKFSNFVENVRKMENALGSKELLLNSKEIEYKKRAGKVVVANNLIKRGSVISKKDLCLKRVSTIPSQNYISRIDEVVDKLALLDFDENTAIDKNSLK